MRTFQIGDCCLFPNSDLHKSAISYAQSKGVPVSNGMLKDFGFNDYPALHFGSGNPNCLGGNFTVYSHDNEITISQFFEYCDNWRKTYPPMVKISNEVNAVVSIQDKVVYFNNYAMSFDNINELHKLINQ